MNYGKYTVMYHGNRRQLTRFAYQLLKSGCKPLLNAEGKKVFKDITFCTKHFSGDCSITIFRDREFMVNNNRVPNPAELIFKPNQYREALAAVLITE